MIIHGTADIEAYFERLADNHPDIMDFVVGDSEHILSRDRSSLEYPCLWLESPNVNWDFGTKRSMDYEFSISILENVPDDAWRREQYLKHKLLLITGHILHQINQDAEAGIILLTGKRAKSMFLPRMGNDNSILWRTDLVFSTPLSWCAPTCKLPDACPAGTLAMFKWENSITGGFTGLSVTNLSKPTDEMWDYEWEWQIDDGAPQSSTSETPAISGAGDWIYISLKITGEDESCVRYASAYFNHLKNCGVSVPYLINKKDC